MLSKFTFEKEIEAFAIEINLRKVKWLLVCSYNPNFCNLPVHLNATDKATEFYSKTSDKILMLEILMRKWYKARYILQYMEPKNLRKGAYMF